MPSEYYLGRPETIEETAEMVTARGGKGIPVVVNHLETEQVKQLIARIRREQGKLHALVNDISESAEHELGKTFWAVDLEKGFAMFRNGIHTHIHTSHYATPLLIETAKKDSMTGLIVEIGDGDSYTYRGNIFFDMVKTGGDPPGVCHGPRIEKEKRGGRGADAGLSAFGSDARAFRCYRS